MIGGKDNSPERMQVRLPFSLSSPTPEGLPISPLLPLSSLLFTPSSQGPAIPHPCLSRVSIGLTQKQRGIQYIFIAEFSNREDRKYYLEKDPAHLAFVDDLTKSGFLVNATVVDFTPGVW